jgi:hypothetical protein
MKKPQNPSRFLKNQRHPHAWKCPLPRRPW